jgi:DNA polymerase-3 subunit alpha
MDFCERVDQSAVNARSVETLIRAGAFDSLGHHRASLLAGYERALKKTSSIHRDRNVGQMNMFDAISDEHQIDFELDEIPELPESELLRGEKELLGIYITGHPLARHAEDLELLSTAPIASLVEREDLEDLRLAGSIQSVRRRTTKSGKIMAFLVIEDLTGSVEVVVFPNLLEEAEPILQENSLIVVVGSGEQRGDQVSIRADAIMPLDRAWEKFVDRVTVRLYSTGLEDSYLQQIKEVTSKLRGGSQLWFVLDTPGVGRITLEAGRECSVRPGPEFRRAMEDLFEENVVSFHVRGKSRYAKKGGKE